MLCCKVPINTQSYGSWFQRNVEVTDILELNMCQVESKYLNCEALGYEERFGRHSYSVGAHIQPYHYFIMGILF